MLQAAEAGGTFRQYWLRASVKMRGQRQQVDVLVNGSEKAGMGRVVVICVDMMSSKRY